MIIPGKYQKSRENDVENSNRINNITKRYISCLKKYASSFNNKTISNKEVYSFQKKVLDWFFNLSFIDRLKVSSINNKWCFQTLHQLYIEQKAKKSLKFIPRFEQIIIPFMKNLEGKGIFADNPGHFLHYFAFSCENYELIHGYNEILENEFLKEINLLYPDLTKTSKIQINGNSGITSDLGYLLKFHYPTISLSESVLNDQKKFEKFFKILSNNNFFVKPPEIITSIKQKEMSLDNSNDNKIMDNFNSNNQKNSIMKNFQNNSTSNDNSNNFNNKIPNLIDIPEWAKQPSKSKLCFSISELFLAFFEQNILVYYIIYLYDNQYYTTLMNDNCIKNLEEFYTLKKELKDFLLMNKEDLLNILNLEEITKDIYYDANIEKFVNIKKYQNNNIFGKTKFWKENVGYDEVYNLIKEFFCGYNNDEKSMIKLINDIRKFFY